MQDIINLTQDEVLKISFSELRELWLGFKPLPFGVKGLQVLEGIDPYTYGVLESQGTLALYREISFFWNKTGPDGISAEIHIAIVDWFILVMLLFMVSRYFAWFLVVTIFLKYAAYRHFSEENHKSIYAKTSDVHWEYHLSKATASRRIRNSLLTIHYLFTERNDYIDRNTTLESLPLSFLNASLAWFRVGSELFCLDGNDLCQKHYGHQNADDGNEGDDDEGEDDENEANYNPDEEFQGEGFESWCQQVIAAKRDGDGGS